MFGALTAWPSPTASCTAAGSTTGVSLPLKEKVRGKHPHWLPGVLLLGLSAFLFRTQLRSAGRGDG